MYNPADEHIFWEQGEPVDSPRVRAEDLPDGGKSSLSAPLPSPDSKRSVLDRSYMRMAYNWAENSYAIRRKVGALIVKDGMIISDGYNGTPSGFPNVCEDADNATLPHVLHAEANAITKLARHGGMGSEGATIYTTTQPCMECSKLIIQAGIKRVVYVESYHDESGLMLLKEAGVEVEDLPLPLQGRG